MATGKSRVGNKQRRERQREQISGVREGAKERIKNGVGRKWQLERTPENLGIRRINIRQSNWL
jgi:hypothetical protein